MSARAETKALFSLIEELDFVIFSALALPRLVFPKITGPVTSGKTGAPHRICRLTWKKMSDRRTWHAFEHRSNFHRLDIEFDEVQPRLDDTKSMPTFSSIILYQGLVTR